MSTQSSTTHILNMLTLITKMITLDTLQKCRLYYPMFFLLFQSNDKTGQECAEWCVGTAECNGFAVVDPCVRPGIDRCYLKRALTYPPPLPDERATFIYYRLNSEFQGEESPPTTIPQTTIPPTTTLGKFTITPACLQKSM